MSKLFLSGIICFVLSVVSFVLEKVFYGGSLDENNVVQESFFLPLTFMLAFLASAIFTVCLVRYLWQKKMY